MFFQRKAVKFELQMKIAMNRFISASTKIIILINLLFLFSSTIHADERKDSIPLSLKTNAVEWSVFAPNVAAEYGLNKHISADIDLGINAWNRPNNKKYRFMHITGELRYWTHEVFQKSFWGIHASAGSFNINKVKTLFFPFKKDYRYQGTFYNIGVGYGRRWNIDGHWDIEAEIGLGYYYALYDRYNCETCGAKLDENKKGFFGPTKVAVNLVYTLGKKEEKIKVLPAVYTPRPHKKLTPAEKYKNIEAIAEKYPFVREVGSEARRDRRLTVRFPVNNAVIKGEYMGNASSLRDILQAVQDISVDQYADLNSISITGFASPEGNEEYNRQLSKERAQALKEYILNFTSVDADIITISAEGEDWMGLRDAVAKSKMAEKNQILNIIDNTPEDLRKEKLIKLNGGQTWYKLLHTIFPWLRDACYINVWYKKK